MIGENIRKRRIELKMSQQQLADALGYKTRSSIAKIENGETELKPSKLTGIANILNTTVQYLITGVDVSEKNRNRVILHSEISALSSPENEMGNASHEQIAAIILAGGQSARNEQNTPNQFLSVNGKPIIMYVLETYQNHPAIGEIYVVCLSGWESILSAYAKQSGITKLKGIIPAGETGIISVKHAVEWLSGKYAYHDLIVIQESTRPLVTHEMISNAIHCAHQNGSAVIYEPMDEYLQFFQNTNGVEYIDRTKLISIQSPEAYRFGKLHRSFLQAERIQHHFNETCCAMFLYNLGSKLVFCEGNRFNIKIVRQEDLEFAKALISNMKNK